ncbi:P-loop NTPase fold protein [Providencia sp. CIM-Carb-044]|uniref:P-loop NTPase fold protein n=1 Tax=Providencia sp. CIM-Carb-044 TaxID=3096048 RepID=UPI0029DDA490|nr:P-loop NTPase fold protein [Providencia sp. CIM-Carb-044]MDX7422494.1 P-loop NTPase fold protein [Providencia sp. CIM-Carb-044]
MKNDNSLIYYLNQFCNNNLGYALLINGAWGTGKTFFIKKYMHENKSKNKFIYNSLYNISTNEDLNRIFYNAAHPIMENDSIKHLQNIVKKTVTIALKSASIDIDTNELTTNLKKELDAKEFNKINEKVFIFDDIERCTLPIEMLLGYINNLSEHSDAKVIIIGNECEIRNKEEYLKIKEKSIGKTIEFHSKISESLVVFNDELENKTLKKTISDNIEKLAYCLSTSKTDNFRTVRSFLYESQTLFNLIENKFLSKNSLLSDLIYTHMMIYLEVKNNNLNIDNLLTYEVLSSDNNDLKKKLINHSLYSNDLILNPSLWYNILNNDIIDRDELNNAIQNYLLSTESEPPVWYKLWSYKHIEINNIYNLMSQQLKKIRECQFDDMGELFHISAFLLFMNNEEVLNLNEDKLVNKIKKNISSILRSGKTISFSSIPGVSTITFFGHGVIGEKLDGIQSCFKFLKSEIRKIDNNISMDIIKQIKNELKNDPFSFKNTITSNHNKNHLNLPVLSNINPNNFSNVFIKHTQPNRLNILSAIQFRFHNSKNTQYIEDEKKWLHQVIETFKLKLTNKNINKITKHYLEIFIKEFNNILTY